MYKNTGATVIVGEKEDTKDNWDWAPDFMYKTDVFLLYYYYYY